MLCKDQHLTLYRNLELLHTIWKEWPHFPITEHRGSVWMMCRGLKVHLRRVQSSPGYLQVGQVPSNCTRQIPQTSSSGMSHRHEATAFHSLIVTFIVERWFATFFFARRYRSWFSKESEIPTYQTERIKSCKVGWLSLHCLLDLDIVECGAIPLSIHV